MKDSHSSWDSFFCTPIASGGKAEAVASAFRGIAFRGIVSRGIVFRGIGPIVGKTEKDDGPSG